MSKNKASGIHQKNSYKIYNLFLPIKMSTNTEKFERFEVIETKPDCEIVTSRIFEHSIEKVFYAWKNPNHLKNWWWPEGFSNTFETFDFSPWGHWKFIMHGPDWTNYPNESIFIEINDQQSIIFSHIVAPKFQVHALFKKIWENSTQLTFIMKFLSVEECNAVKIYAVGKNEENMDRLETELQKMK